jgi:hypothetical protein
MMTAEERELSDLVQRIVEQADGEVWISPAWVATAVMMKIDPDRSSPRLVYQGCHLQLRQIARACLRGHFDPVDEDNPQHELFTGLQDRYPVKRKRGEDPRYVLREAMSDEDAEFNVHRFRNASLALTKHADALKAWLENRRSAS